MFKKKMVIVIIFIIFVALAYLYWIALAGALGG